MGCQTKNNITIKNKAKKKKKPKIVWLDYELFIF